MSGLPERDHGVITRHEVYHAVQKLVKDKWPDRDVETIVLPGMDRSDAKPGYVLFRERTLYK